MLRCSFLNNAFCCCFLPLDSVLVFSLAIYWCFVPCAMWIPMRLSLTRTTNSRTNCLCRIRQFFEVKIEQTWKMMAWNDKESGKICWNFCHSHRNWIFPSHLKRNLNGKIFEFYFPDENFLFSNQISFTNHINTHTRKPHKWQLNLAKKLETKSP